MLAACCDELSDDRPVTSQLITARGDPRGSIFDDPYTSSGDQAHPVVYICMYIYSEMTWQSVVHS